jgi:signal transduction histidine kinase
MKFFKKDNEVENKSIFYYKLQPYYLVEISGLIIPVFAAITMILFPEYYAFFENLNQIIISSIIISVIHGSLFILYEVTKKVIFFNIARYTYIFFFFLIIIFTGGINSSLSFLLFFPIIVSSVYLDSVTTKRVGIIEIIFFALLIFAIPIGEITKTLVTKHILQTTVMAAAIYLMNRVVVETLKQKTEKEEAARKINEMTKIDQLKNDFLSVAEHQLRTPLSGVKWALESIKNDSQISPEGITLVDAGLERVDDSLKIINNMLKTVEEKDGTLTLAKGNVDIASMVRFLISELNFVVLKKDIKVITDIPEVLIIKADKEKMKAAINNILDNAFKYSPHGKVEISLTDNNKEVIFIVKDTGIGISNDDMQYIFSRLHRGKNAVMLEPDESGVGLYISKKIIELHGGSISINSTIGKGTTVKVVLPI